MKFLLPAIIAGLICTSISSFAQETDLPLRYNGAQAALKAKEREFPQGENRSGGSLELPFFDDFSRYSLPSNDPSIPDAWQRWTDNTAFINSTFPVSPMTIGVATLDGLDDDGTPYADTLYFPSITETFLEWGLADSLTSLPIDLSGYTPEDSVHLVFHYECGGLGNQPDADGILGAEGDSLILEFYSPLQQGQWFRAWAIEGGLNANVFDTVFIHISDFVFLQNGFRFRFKNMCTQHGALDHWHLDYVILNSNIQPSSFLYDEVAFQYSNNTLLNFDYTSMPWTHFESDPEYYMMDEFTFYQRNLGESQNISTRWRVNYEGSQQHLSTSNDNTSGNALQEIQRTVSLENYFYTTPTTVDSASFEVCTYFNPTDIHLENDTMCFTQTFSNYYSYDDGSAERAYGLQNTGGKMAMRFNSAIDDTLLGVYIYFIPIQYLATDQSFILQVWNDVTGQPGNLLTSEFDNFNFHNPQYYTGGPNLFVYYPLLDPVAISAGNFYIGCLQQNAVSLNLGLDKNTGANATKLFYQLQGTSTWNQSEIAGSVMIRPVFKAGLPEWVSTEENAAQLARVYPNPAHDNLQVVLNNQETYTYSVCDMTGRQVMSGSLRANENTQIDISRLSPASYMLLITSTNGEHFHTSHFIKY